MKYFLIIIIAITLVCFTILPTNVKLFAATNTQSADDQQMQAILNQVQQNQIAQKEQLQQKQAAANQQAQNQDPKSDSVKITGWMYVLLIIYCITILLLWIFLIMAIFSMARWMRRRDKVILK